MAIGETITNIRTALGRKLLGEQGKIGRSRFVAEAQRWPLVTDDLVEKKGVSQYRKMRDDPDVKAALLIKSGGVLSRGWEVTAADDQSAEAGQQADFVQWAFDTMQGSLDDVLEEVLADGLAYGTGLPELVWKLQEGGDYSGFYTYAAIKPKDPTLYDIQTDEYNNITQLWLSLGTGERVQVDPSKFPIFTYQAAHGDPWGRSDLRGAYRYYWAKEKLVQWWLIWLEKYGMPTVVGKYKRGTPKQLQDELLAALDKIKTETAITVPDDASVDFLTANQMISGGGGYSDALEWVGKQIVRCIIGQTLTTDEGTRVGSMALGKVHQDILDLYIKKLKRTVEEYVDERFIRPLVDYNFAQPLYPNFTLQIDDTDVQSLSEVIWRLTSVDVVDPRETWIREYLGLPAREELPPEPQSAVTPPTGGPDEQNPTQTV